MYTEVTSFYTGRFTNYYSWPERAIRYNKFLYTVATTYEFSNRERFVCRFNKIYEKLSVITSTRWHLFVKNNQTLWFRAGILARGILMEKRLELIILTKFEKKIKQKKNFMKLENVEVCREPHFRRSRQSPMTSNSLTNHTLNS